jgi:hypothetical protein
MKAGIHSKVRGHLPVMVKKDFLKIKILKNGHTEKRDSGSESRSYPKKRF